MHISKVQVKNFRNLQDFEIELSEKTILLGENGTGKTNFFEALRLVLDQNYRGQLSSSDFSHGVAPFSGTKIEVHMWFSGFDPVKDKDLLACAHDCRVSQEGEPLKVKLSSVYQPRPNQKPEDALGEDQYEIVRYARDDATNTQGATRFRSFVRMVLVPALRDMDRDMQTWRLSPMRRMVELMSLAQNDDFKQVAQQVKSAAERLQKISPIEKLQEDIRGLLGEIIEDASALDPKIGLLPSSPDDLQKMLTLLVEMGLPLERSSLGLTNILYLIMWMVYLERLRTSVKVNLQSQFTILAIEEPEAHLHPHLQRLVFGNVFKRDLPILVSTHSPTIVSLAKPDWFALFKRSKNGTVAVSTAKIAQLDRKLRRDLSRFLDATRGEIVFARGVLLVEGDAELFLVPEMARRLKEAGKIVRTLDGAGISVCSVYGTDFRPYVRFLGPSGLNLPFAVVTDGDRDGGLEIKWTKGDDYDHYAGLKRGIDLVQYIDNTLTAALQSDYQEKKWEEIREDLKKVGIFVNHQTLEDELLSVGYRQQFIEVYEELGGTQIQQKNMSAEIDGKEIDKVIRRIETTGMGKGKFAQRLADRIEDDKIPSYIEQAIEFVLKKAAGFPADASVGNELTLGSTAFETAPV